MAAVVSGHLHGNFGRRLHRMHRTAQVGDLTGPRLGALPGAVAEQSLRIRVKVNCQGTFLDLGRDPVTLILKCMSWGPGMPVFVGGRNNAARDATGKMRAGASTSDRMFNPLYYTCPHNLTRSTAPGVTRVRSRRATLTRRCCSTRPALTSVIVAAKPPGGNCWGEATRGQFSGRSHQGVPVVSVRLNPVMPLNSWLHFQLLPHLFSGIRYLHSSVIIKASSLVVWRLVRHIA